MATSALDLLKAHRPHGMSCDKIQREILGGGENISRAAIEHYLSGRRRLSLWAFDRIARAFGLPEDQQRLGRLMIQAEWEREDSSAPGRGEAPASA